MKIGTWSIVVGTNACNAKCPYCVSRMTSTEKLSANINWRNFEVAKKLANKKGVTTVLLTGKGEPTLYPWQIMEYLKKLEDFPFIELQTNGIELLKPEYGDWLSLWYIRGLTTVCISVIDYDNDRNAEIYGVRYDLPALINRLHKIGYSVRLNVIGIKGYIDNPKDFMDFLMFARENEVEQVTYRPVNMTDAGDSMEVYHWTKAHLLGDGLAEIQQFVRKHAIAVMSLPHGAVVYDYHGQNVCISDCLTINPGTDDLRQIIFFPDGAIRYDWRYKGARLL